MIKLASITSSLLLVLFSLTSHAAIKTETVEYTEGPTKLEGFLAYDDAAKGKRPGVVIVHEWMGLGDYVKGRAKQLAELGYVAFAADIYGKGVRPKNTDEAKAQVMIYKGDRNLMRARAKAAYDTLKNNPKVDAGKMLAMGYCFGGTTAIEMALSGLPLKGVVSFHGGLDFPSLATDAKNIKAPLLILHGAVDPNVPPDQVNTFTKALEQNKVDYEFVAYSGAVHAFTQPQAGNDPSKGAAYNEKADKRSFQAMKDFFQEVTMK
jgi:dienelactone hydrolase